MSETPMKTVVFALLSKCGKVQKCSMAPNAYRIRVEGGWFHVGRFVNIHFLRNDDFPGKINDSEEMEVHKSSHMAPTLMFS